MEISQLAASVHHSSNVDVTPKYQDLNTSYIHPKVQTHMDTYVYNYIKYWELKDLLEGLENRK